MAARAVGLTFEGVAEVKLTLLALFDQGFESRQLVGGHRDLGTIAAGESDALPIVSPGKSAVLRCRSTMQLAIGSIQSREIG